MSATETPKNTETAPAAAEPKSSPSKSGDPKVSEAMQLLASGKRNLLVSDIPAACEALADSCQLFAEIYGEAGIECGEANFTYGKALLELARLENGVLENGLDGMPEESGESESEDSRVEDPEKCTEDEKKEVSDKVAEAIEENFQQLEKVVKEKTKSEAAAEAVAAEEKKEVNGEAKKEDAAKEEAVADKKASPEKAAPEAEKSEETKKDEKSEDKPAEEESKEKTSEKSAEAKTDEPEDKENQDNDDKENEEAEAEAAEGEDDGEEEEKDGNESIGSNEAGSSSKKDVEDKSEVEKEDEEDVGNLQLAWEVLEVAKLCFTKHADSLGADDPKRMEIENRLSETYQVLGEVSIENEDYAKAIEDLTSCLRRRQELLPEDSRDIAETHYQMGVALGFNMEFEKSVQCFHDAIAVLEKRIANLKAKTESKDPSSKVDAFCSREKEISEIEGLIPEIKEKIADTLDMEKEAAKKVSEQLNGAKIPDEDADAEATKKVGGEMEISKKEESNGFSNGAAASSSEDKGKSAAAKPISDISHMVKKRKKDEENGTNGTSTTNGAGGDTNGHVDSPAKRPHIEAANGTAAAADSAK